METLPDRLRTRFESGLPVDIQIPTYETKMAIINKKSEALGIDFPYEVKDLALQLILLQVSGSLRERLPSFQLILSFPTHRLLQSLLRIHLRILYLLTLRKRLHQNL